MAAWGDSAVLTLRYRSTAFFLKETLSERVSYGGCLRLALRDKIALVRLQKIAVEFWMPKLGGSSKSSPLVVKTLLAGFHIHTNKLF